MQDSEFEIVVAFRRCVIFDVKCGSNLGAYLSSIGSATLWQYAVLLLLLLLLLLVAENE